VDLATGTLRGSITLPVFDANLAITPDGQQIWTPGQIKDTTAGIIAYHLAGAMGAVLPTLSNQAVAFAPLVPAVPR
jgi:hypothetical protein